MTDESVTDNASGVLIAIQLSPERDITAFHAVWEHAIGSLLDTRISFPA